VVDTQARASWKPEGFNSDELEEEPLRAGVQGVAVYKVGSGVMEAYFTNRS